MSYNPKDGYPRLVPVLAYRDVAAALAWLSEAFGFTEVLRWTDPTGVVRVAEMDSGGAALMLESRAESGAAREPHTHGCHSVLTFVDDADQHVARARKAGARILAEPEDKPWGLRQYLAVDLDGHRWEFSQHLRDVRPEDWGATPAN